MTEELPLRTAGIYIDLRNIFRSSYDYMDNGLYIDYKRLIAKLSEGYDVQFVKAYDNELMENDESGNLHQVLAEAGVELVLTPLGLKTNSDNTKQTAQKEVDTGIVADVSWDLAESKIDVAIIVSGDRDMLPAVDRARRRNKTVVVVGLENTISRFYDLSDTDCIFIDDLDVFRLNEPWSYFENDRSVYPGAVI